MPTPISDAAKPIQVAAEVQAVARPNTSAGIPRPRMLEVDALRGLAAAVVMLFHYTTATPHGHGDPLWLHCRFGPESVWLFFAISGFVILMTAESCRSLADFAVARFARLYPAYWVAVGASLLIARNFGEYTIGISNSRLHALINLTMLQEAFGVPHLDGPFWSLYVEVTFYVFVGVLIATRRLAWLPYLLLVLAIIHSLAAFAVGWPFFSGLAAVADIFPVTRYSAYFCLGVWCYRWVTHRDWWFIPVVFCLCFCVAANGTALPFIVIASIFIAATNGWLPWLANPLLLFLGTISYSLYLLHQNLGHVVIGLLEERGVESNLAVLVAIMASVVTATVVCYTVERPANSFIRRRWKAIKARAPSPEKNPVPAPG